MADKQKRKMNPKSLENLQPFNTKSLSERRELAKKGAEKTNQIKAAKIKRENAKEWLWNEYGLTLSEEVLTSGSVRDKLELLKAILPPDKQTQELIGNLGVQKVFVTQEEIDEVDKLIEDTYNEQ